MIYRVSKCSPLILIGAYAMVVVCPLAVMSSVAGMPYSERFIMSFRAAISLGDKRTDKVD